MAPTGDDDHYHPKDAVSAGLRNGAIFGGVGLLVAAVKNSLEKKNVGPWKTFTRRGELIAAMAAVGGVYEFTRLASANLREKEDFWNEAIGGFLGGATIGLRSGRMTKILGFGALTGVVTAVYDYTGGSLKGRLERPEMDEYERKEMLRKNRRRPIEETLAEIGEGRGIKPPGYEERRRERIKERYGIEVKTFSANPDAA